MKRFVLLMAGAFALVFFVGYLVRDDDSVFLVGLGGFLGGLVFIILLVRFLDFLARTPVRRGQRGEVESVADDPTDPAG